MAALQPPTRVVIADRSEEICHALARLLGADPSIEVCSTVQTEDELLDNLAQATPDVVLLDYQLPNRSIDRLIVGLRARVPDLAILVLLVHPGDVSGVEADSRTAWVLKDSNGKALRAQVRALAPIAS
jgi:two-component system NarL family response regulator